MPQRSKRHSFMPLLFTPPDRSLSGEGVDLETIPPRPYESGVVKALQDNIPTPVVPRPASGVLEIRKEDETFVLDVRDVELLDHPSLKSMRVPAFAEEEIVEFSWPEELDRRRSTKSESHVRLLANLTSDGVELLAAEELLDVLCDEQIAFTHRLDALETAVAAARSARYMRDGNEGEAHLCWFDLRIRDLARVRDSMALLQLTAVARSLHPLFLPNTPLAEYLRGIYAWTHAISRALDVLILASQEGTLEPRDWVSFRWRIEEAKNFHFHELSNPISEDIETLASITDDRLPASELMTAFDALSDHACRLQVNLEQV